MPLYGSTCSIEPAFPGAVLKKPHQVTGECIEKRIANNFFVEQQILKRLGQHPRIVRHLSQQEDGILLGEASHGNLQAYLDEHHASTSLDQRLLWCRQLAEALSYIHSRGVLHSDLRPANLLIHETTLGSRDLLLADFGGSVCEELGVDGLSLPDGPFYSPVFNWRSSVSLDRFGMGSTFYTIHTGRWPYKTTPGRFETFDERVEWEENVAYPNFKENRFLDDVDSLPAGDAILKCWRREFATAKEALAALDKSLEEQGYKSVESTLGETKGEVSMATGFNSGVDGVGGQLERPQNGKG